MRRFIWLPSTYPTLSHTQCVQTNSLLHFFSYIYNEFTFFAWHYKSESFDILWNTHKIHYIDLKFECIFIVIHCTCITHLQNFGIKTFGFFDFQPYLQSLLIFLLFWAFNKNGVKKRCLHSGYLKCSLCFQLPSHLNATIFDWMYCKGLTNDIVECNNIWQDVLQRLSKWYWREIQI